MISIGKEEKTAKKGAISSQSWQRHERKAKNQMAKKMTLEKSRRLKLVKKAGMVQ